MNMLGLFRRAAQPAIDTSALGARVVALRLPAGCPVPAGCGGVVVSEGGRTRRVGEGKQVLAAGEQAWGFHPGPYMADIVPFAGAPEIGLRVAFAIDSPDPRQPQQRFDLYLASEGGQQVELAPLAREIELAVQRELAQGNLELPPCATLDEWNAFRAGFNQLLYTRFGVTVDDCVPVDLGESRDYAALLRERASSGVAAPVTAVVPVQVTPDGEPFDVPEVDARALRRLFLELPCLMCRLRLAVLPPGQELFRQQQALLQRLDLASLSAGTMPALELAAPGEPLPAVEQLRRARHSRRAALALDEAWALLARLEHADGAALPALFDEADRIVANLERDIAARCTLTAEAEAA